MSKATVKVSIFDQSYSLVTDETQAHLEQAAQMVDECMRRTARLGIADKQKIAVLVALQLASDCVRTQSAHKSKQEEYDTVIKWLEQQNRILSEFL